MRVAGAVFSFLAMAAVGCGGDAPPPPAAHASKTSIPHSCKGAGVKVLLVPEHDLPPAAVVKAPEFGPEPPPVETDTNRRPSEAAGAVARAIERAIPNSACRPEYDSNMFRWGVSCGYGGREDDPCKTSYEVAQHRAAQIRAIVTRAVQVNVYDCVCRIY